MNSNFTSCRVSGFVNAEVLNGVCAIIIVWRVDIKANIVALDTDSQRVCSVLIDLSFSKFT